MADNMADINELRARIRETDGRLAALFEERMELARQVAAYKQENCLPVKDPMQEDRVVDFYLSALKDPDLAPYARAFARSLIGQSCIYQEDCIKKASGFNN